MNNINPNTTDLRKTEIGKIFDSKMEALELEDSPEIKTLYDQLYNMTDMSQIGNLRKDSSLTDVSQIGNSGENSNIIDISLTDNPGKDSDLIGLIEKIVYEKMKQSYISGYEFALSITLGI